MFRTSHHRKDRLRITFLLNTLRPITKFVDWIWGARRTGRKHAHLAVYPGSFDPITCGHLDIARRAARIFDTVIVAVAEHSGKNMLFSTDERAELVRQSTHGIPNIRRDFSGTLDGFCPPEPCPCHYPRAEGSQ